MPAAPVITLTKRTITSLESLNSTARERFLAFLENIGPGLAEQGVRVEVIAGLRSWQQQAALYAQGRTVPGRIVTHAPAGSSWHNYGLAIDLGLFRGGVYLDEASPREADKLYQSIMPEAEKLGIECGGRWKGRLQDTPHFQYRQGIASIAAAKEKFLAHGMNIQRMLA